MKWGGQRMGFVEDGKRNVKYFRCYLNMCIIYFKMQNSVITVWEHDRWNEFPLSKVLLCGEEEEQAPDDALITQASSKSEL